MNLLPLSLLVGKYPSSSGGSNELFHSAMPKMDAGFKLFCTGKTSHR